MTATKWPEVRLDSVAEVRLGRQRSPKNHAGTQMRPYVRAANIGWDGLKLDDVKEMNFTDEEMAVYSLAPGDLLLGEASGSPHEVGKPAIWEGEVEACAFQNTLLRVRPRGPDPRYLLHFFKFQALSGGFARRSRGVGIHHLGREALASLDVPLPPIEEQRRIAAVLDQADALRTKRRESLAHLASLTESIFREMFTTDSPAPRRPLGEHLTYLTSGSRGWAKFYSDRGSPFLRIENVGRDELHLSSLAFVSAPDNSEAKRTRLRAGDVVMSITADLGRTAVVPPELDGGYINQHLCLMRSDSLSPRYLSAFLSSLEARSQIESRNRQAVKAGLNFDDVRSLQVPSPPRNLQDDFSARASAIDTARVQLAASTEALDELFASLQQRAFRGDL